MRWPEVIESVALKLTWVKMDGLMRQLQKTGCSTDNTCNFILYKAAYVTTLPT